MSARDGEPLSGADVPITPEQNRLLGEFAARYATWLRLALKRDWGQRAEDIAQEVFLYLRRHPATITGIRLPQGWLLWMGQRVGRNLHRSESRKVRLHQAAQLVADEGDPAAQTARREARRELAQAIRKLCGARRIACARRFIKGESIEVIAAKIRRGSGTIFRWTKRFLENFGRERVL